MTVVVSTGRDLTEQVLPPRSLFVNHPMGNAFGAPGDEKMQRDILERALDLVVTADTPGVIVDAPFDWPQSFEFAAGQSRM